MRDGFIEDFQIWSPSEDPDFPSQAGRPDDVGWCPHRDEFDVPFLQVYLYGPPFGHTILKQRRFNVINVERRCFNVVCPWSLFK